MIASSGRSHDLVRVRLTAESQPQRGSADFFDTASRPVGLSAHSYTCGTKTAGAAMRLRTGEARNDALAGDAASRVLASES